MNCKAIISLYLLGTLCVAGCGGAEAATPRHPHHYLSQRLVQPHQHLCRADDPDQSVLCHSFGNWSYSSAVTWSASSGTISTTGVYTAPATVPTSGTATITATSTEDATKSGAATVTITPAVSVVTSCCRYPLRRGFLDLLSDRHKHDEHRCDVVGVGRTISSGGVLSTAGVAPGTQITVKATSVADTGAFGSATVTVTPHHYIRDRLVLAGHLAGSHDRNQPMHSTVTEPEAIVPQ